MTINPLTGKSIPKHLYSPILALPIEVFIQSFTELDPISLFNCSLVDKEWNHVIKDDTTWRDGFGKAFGLNGIQEKNRDNRNPRVGLRRIDNKSWRNEYWRRVDLAR